MRGQHHCAFLVLAALVVGAAWPSAPVQALSLTAGPYVQAAGANHVTVIWITDLASDSTAAYGSTPSYGLSATDPSPVTAHAVVLSGLTPGAQYHYQISSAAGADRASSPDAAFWTAPTAGVSFRFGVYGDTQDDSIHAQVALSLLADAPRFVVHVGDLTNDGTQSALWMSQFFGPAAPLLPSTPLFSALGNHEYDSALYYTYMRPPPGGGEYGEQWYSFDYGDAHFTVLDSNADYTPGSAQYQWLMNDLATTTARWKFVVHHHPAYSSGPLGGTVPIQNYLVPLYEQYHVDVVFSGHDHLYERSFKNGVQYITTGGGGGALVATNVTPNPYQQFALSTHHHCTIDFTPAALTLRAIATDGTVFDTVTLSHAPIRPIADFYGAPRSGAAPLAVQFHDTSGYAPTDWSWDFGDGGAATEGSPSHVYAASGSYTVSLTATNAGGSDTETKPGYITAAMPPPAAAFSCAPTSGLAPLTVQFTDQSTNTPASWEWDFGDGARGSDQSPTHTYGHPGRVTVRLTVTNAGGSDTAEQPNSVLVSFPDVPLDFWDLEDILDCADGGVVFGYPDGTYRPEVVVTRDQMAVYVARALAGGDAGVPTQPARTSFSDVPSSHWAYRYVEYAQAHGIVQGYDDGTYRPDAPVDRAQMSVFISRSVVTPTGEAGLASYVPPTTPTFSDVPTSYWAYRYVEYLRAHEIVGGYPDGTYRPEAPVSRDQLAAFVTAILGY